MTATHTSRFEKLRMLKNMRPPAAAKELHDSFQAFSMSSAVQNNDTKQ